MPPEQDVPKGRHAFATHVTFTGVLTVVFLLIAAMTAAYVWGVMSGRRLALSESEAKMSAMAEQSPQPAANSEKQDEILKPYELDFVHELRGDARPAPKSKQGTVLPKKQPSEAEPQQAAQPSQGTVRVTDTPNPGQETPVAIYDHVFQLVALKDEQAADNLREKLEGRGLRTRLERSGKMLVVLVLLRGDAARAAEVYHIASELRLGQPLLRSKKPVSR